MASFRQVEPGLVSVGPDILVHRGTHGTEAASITSLCQSEVQPGERGNRREKLRCGCGHLARQRAQDALDLIRLPALHLAPAVACVNRAQRFNKQCLAASRGIMNNPRNPGPKVRFHRNDVPALAESDYRLLDGLSVGTRSQYGAQQLLQAVVSAAELDAYPSKRRACRIQHVPALPNGGPD